MFELTAEEFQEWRSQFGTSNEGDRLGCGMRRMYLQNKG